MIKKLKKILNEFHGSTSSNLHIGGHFAVKATTYKIIRLVIFGP
jgi:hypothetical protein